MGAGPRYIAAMTVLLVGMAGAAAVAQEGLPLMAVEAGARPAGMGGAFVAVHGDADAAFYNPAGISGIRDISASFGHNTYWERISLETGYVGIRLSRRSYLYGSMRFAGVSDLEFRTAPTADPEGLFDAHDLSFKAGLAWDVNPRVVVGLAAGWFIEKIEAWRGSSFNVDIGAQAQVTESIRLGASASNLGSDLTLTVVGRSPSRPIPLPKVYRVGGTFVRDRYRAVTDLVLLDDRIRLHLGGEARVHDVLTVRAGYMANYDSKSVTAGFSLRKRNIGIDYAVVPFSHNLGTAHLFNLTFQL